MKHVTLTEEEMWESSSPISSWPAFALMKKGIRFKPTFGVPTEEHLLPPWRVERDCTTGVLHVWQGEQE